MCVKIQVDQSHLSDEAPQGWPESSRNTWSVPFWHQVRQKIKCRGIEWRQHNVPTGHYCACGAGWVSWTGWGTPSWLASSYRIWPLMLTCSGASAPCMSGEFIYRFNQTESCFAGWRHWPVGLQLVSLGWDIFHLWESVWLQTMGVEEDFCSASHLQRMEDMEVEVVVVVEPCSVWMKISMAPCDIQPTPLVSSAARV